MPKKSSSIDKELQFLKTKLKNIKSSLTRFKSFLSSLEQIESNVIPLEVRLAKIEPILDEFNAVQCQIDSLQTSDASFNDLDDLDEIASFKEAYFEALTSAKVFVSRFTTQTQNSSSEHQPNTSSSSVTNLVHQSEVKLPAISLPTFDGGIENWTCFKDTFESLMNAKTNLSNIEKFHYLRSSLQSCALTVIDSLEISADNYEIAWSLLKQRFENRRLILNNHLNSLFALPQISKESHVAIRQLVDNYSKHLRALKTLKQPVDSWHTLIVHLIASKLDTITRKDWERQKGSGDYPTVAELTSFLQNKCQMLETIESSKIQEIKPKTIKAYSTTATHNCAICKSKHSIYQCEKFRKLSVSDRIAEVKKLKLCINCLRSGHLSKYCKSSTCKICQKSHNTLLHLSIDKPSETEVQPQLKPQSPSLQFSAVTQRGDHDYVLLSTAIVNIVLHNGKKQKCRVLLDSASQSSFITTALCQQLRLKTTVSNVSISGINQVVTNITSKAKVKIQSLHNNFSINIDALVIPKITDPIPSIALERSKFNIPPNIRLADNNFCKPSNVDMLLGANVFWQLICIGQIKLGKNNPMMLQKTTLGWIVAGSIPTAQSNERFHSHVVTETQLSAQIQRFWEFEEIKNNSKILSSEEQACEDQFIKTTKRSSNGQFIVRLPLKEEPSCLGDSKQLAFNRLLALERKFENNPNSKISIL